MADLVFPIYVNCIDFIINLANLTDSSYYEINLVAFCILYPRLLLGPFSMWLIQRCRFEGMQGSSMSESVSSD